MARNYSMGARTAKAAAADRVDHAERRSLRERFGGLRNVPPFLRLVWQTSPSIMLTQAVLRLVRALLPVATLYVGKLIIDEVLRLAGTPRAGDDLREWFASGGLDTIAWLLFVEFALAVLSDVLGRTVQARVTSVRDVAWEDSRTGGFMFVFRPGPLSAAPHTFIGITRAPEEAAA